MNKTALEKIADSRCPSHSGVLLDVCKGEKWIYRKKDAILAVAFSYCVGGCGIFGDSIPFEDAKIFLAEVIDELRLKGMNTFEFSCEDMKLEKWILHVFDKKEIYSEMENSYRYLKKDVIIPQNGKNQEYTILPVNTNLLDNLGMFENTVILQERLNNSWSRVDYIRSSIGFVAVVQKRFIGIIIGTGRYQDYLSIDIEVEKEYRRQGVANNLTGSFLKECQKRDVIPQWDCVESNKASQGLAEKMDLNL